MKRLLVLLCLLGASFAQVNSARMLSGINFQTGTTYTFVATDVTQLVSFNNPGAVAVTLPSGVTSGFGAGSIFAAKDIGAGTATITCSSCTINSTGTPASTLVLTTGQGADIYADGTNYTANVYSVGAQGATVNGAATPGTGFPLRFVYIYGDSGGTQQVGASGAPTTVGSSLAVVPTATETVGQQWSSSAVGSGSVVAAIGHGQGAGLNGAFNTFGTIARFAIRLKPVTVSNVRMWIGMGDVNGPSDYSNTIYASDAPPRFYCMFRFSFTTDTTWKAICATDATHQTIVDTGVVPTAANSTLFEIIPTAAMTSVAFYINGASVGTVTTNLPAASNRPMMAWMADNKNTATSVGATHFWEQMLYSK